MTIDRIGRCCDCMTLEFLNREGKCEWCLDTATLVYSTGFIQAATPPAPVDGDKPEAA